MKSADISPITSADQAQSPLDLFLIFIGANVVATTFSGRRQAWRRYLPSARRCGSSSPAA
jgi:hypothetical protein